MTLKPVESQNCNTGRNVNSSPQLVPSPPSSHHPIYHRTPHLLFSSLLLLGSCRIMPPTTARRPSTCPFPSHSHGVRISRGRSRGRTCTHVPHTWDVPPTSASAHVRPNPHPCTCGQTSWARTCGSPHANIQPSDERSSGS